jgi:hypothetical protein
MNSPDLSRACWRKSSHSSANGQCVEMADIDRGIAVRESKDPGGPALAFTAAEWEAFTAGVKDGQFDLA